MGGTWINGEGSVRFKFGNRNLMGEPQEGYLGRPPTVGPGSSPLMWKLMPM